jgi:hypothetical protein
MLDEDVPIIKIIWSFMITKTTWGHKFLSKGSLVSNSIFTRPVEVAEQHSQLSFELLHRMLCDAMLNVAKR